MICFVILHYIAVEETVKCVESILNNVEGDKQIVVVDNASPNNSFAVLRREFSMYPNVSIIKTESNLGFAKGNNYGYEYAITHFSPEFVVVMNNDMEILQSDFLSEVQKSFFEYGYYVMGPDIYSTKKGYHQNPQTRKMPTLKDLKKNLFKYKIKSLFLFLIFVKWKIKELMGQNEDKTDQYRKRPYVGEVLENVLLHGSCYVFSPLFLQKHPIQCFCEKTFMYLEAEILHYLCTKNNEKTIYYPYVKVQHHEDVSTDAEFKTQYKKSVFSVRCLLQSTEAFIDIIKNQ